MNSLGKREQILSLYKQILKESSKFFDDKAKEFLKERARKRFKEYKNETNEKRVMMKWADARKALNQLKRANVFDVKAVTRVLKLTYGRIGPKRHKLLKPLIDYPSSSPRPFIRKVHRTAPPRISPPLQSLLSSQVKSLYPTLPEPKHKPLHPRRKANIMWWHYSRIMRQVIPPVTKEELETLEKKAGKGTLSSEGVARIGKINIKDMNDTTTLRLSDIPNMPKTPRDLVREVPYHTARPHNPRKRFIRRIYQRLLTQIPIMKEIPKSESFPKTNTEDKKNIGSLPEVKISDKKNLNPFSKAKSNKSTSINPSDPNKNFTITKSPWAEGRPIPLVKEKDRKGLNPEKVKNQIICHPYKIIRKTHLCIPHLIVNDIRNINFYELKNLGINALAFDKDNTLTTPYSDEIYPPFKSAWEESKKIFGNENLIIVSNSSGTGDDPGFIQAEAIEKSLGVYVLRHMSKKPSCGQELLSHFAAYNPHTIAIIGDRVFTDVLFGNLNGMFTVFTRKIISKKRDNFMATMIRRVEYKMLDYYIAKGIKPPFHPFLKNKDSGFLKKE
ncbi:unnamed protein product [Rhizophagus irregularis]|nr:unnamed protein product [Rhizophagus irregularis]CAB5199248.1 unnamed protein product [Rhizophagus irregularis]CAB5371782.1 unnamed protein product [Rhizophagus irregularis]